MKPLIPAIILIMCAQSPFAQKRFDQLYHNKHFTWLADSASKRVTLYYQSGGWTSSRVDGVRKRILTHIDSVRAFIRIDSYDKPIHFFIVESREQMKELLGRQTNGNAIPESNVVTGIGSENLRSIFSNHELFHLMAMNVWGTPEIWINEGMAVYSDKVWHSQDLYQLTKYLVDQNRTVPLSRLIKRFRLVDDLISYPLMGSFMKFMDEQYGKPAVIKIWKGGNIEDVTGKSIEELEKEWLKKISTVEYKNIKY